MPWPRHLSAVGVTPSPYSQVMKQEVADDAPSDEIRDWLEESPLVGAVLHGRVNPLVESTTLAAVGDAQGVSRERVRQIQARLTEKIDDAGAFAEVLQVAGAFRDHYGPAVEIDTEPPADIVRPLTDRGWSRPDACAVALAATGWRSAGSWCLHPHVPPLPDKADPDQARRLVAHVADLLGQALAERIIDGAVTATKRTSADIGDLLELVLSSSHRPLTPAELRELDPDGRSRNYIENVLADDPRFVRLSKEGYGLVAWNLPPYVGVADAMARAIEDGNDQARLVDLQRDLKAQYGHSPSSVTFYSTSALMFETDDGWVRLRDPATYGEAAVAPSDDPRCRLTVDGHWATDFPVDKDLLRGSGLTVAPGFAAVVGCAPSDSVELHDDAGEAVTVKWPERATSAPQVGSLRSLAERLDASAGDTLEIAWNAATGQIEARLAESGEFDGISQGSTSPGS